MSKTDLDGTNSLTTISRFDPLLRPSMTQVPEDSAAFNVLDKTIGLITERHCQLSGTNMELVSNPYRSNATTDSARRLDAHAARHHGPMVLLDDVVQIGRDQRRLSCSSGAAGTSGPAAELGSS